MVELRCVNCDGLRAVLSGLPVGAFLEVEAPDGRDLRIGRVPDPDQLLRRIHDEADHVMQGLDDDLDEDDRRYLHHLVSTQAAIREGQKAVYRFRCGGRCGRDSRVRQPRLQEAFMRAAERGRKTIYLGVDV